MFVALTAGLLSSTVPSAASETLSRLPSRTPLRLTGTWKDVLYGTTVEVRQIGRRVISRTINPATGEELAVGEGTINGRTISGTSRWNNGSVVKADMKVSDDGRTITGTFRNIDSGQAGSLRLVR